MHIKFTKHGSGSARKAVEYLLQERDHKKEIRAEISILCGNPELVAIGADALKHKQKYKSAVIAWHPDDRPNEIQIRETVDEFISTAYAGLPDDSRLYTAVLHRDDAGTPHVHIIAAATELTTGRALNVAPPGWQKRYDSVRDYLNAKHSWQTPDVSQSPEVQRLLSATPRDPNLDEKNRITKMLASGVRNREIKTRQDVTTVLEQAGIKISRQTKNSITVLSASGKKMRLAGLLYERDLDIEKLRSELQGQNQELVSERLTELRKNMYQQRLKVAEGNQKKYKMKGIENMETLELLDELEASSVNQDQPVQDKKAQIIGKITGRLMSDEKLVAAEHEWWYRRWVDPEAPWANKRALALFDNDNGSYSKHGKLAFVDEGELIQAHMTDQLSLRAMTQAALAKFGDTYNVEGSDEFRREAWLMGLLHGAEVSGYEPTLDDWLELTKRAEKMALDDGKRVDLHPNVFARLNEIAPPDQNGIRNFVAAKADFGAKNSLSQTAENSTSEDADTLSERIDSLRSEIRDLSTEKRNKENELKRRLAAIDSSTEYRSVAQRDVIPESVQQDIANKKQLLKDLRDYKPGMLDFGRQNKKIKVASAELLAAIDNAKKRYGADIEQAEFAEKSEKKSLVKSELGGQVDKLQQEIDLKKQEREKAEKRLAELMEQLVHERKNDKRQKLKLG